MPGDIAAASVSEVSALLAPYDEVLSCIGFAAGLGRKLAQPRSGRSLGANFPRQFGVDYDVLGRGCAHDLSDEQLQRTRA